MIAVIRHDSGTAGRPLVFVPGIDGTGELLLGTAGALSARFRVVRLAYEDDRASLHPGAEHAALAASVAARIEELGLDAPIVLAESFGVALALRVALEHPTAVGGLALVNGFACYGKRLRLGLAVLTAPLIAGPLFRLGRRIALPHVLIAPRREPEVERAFLALEGRRLDRGYARRLAMLRHVDLRPRLGEIAHPARIYASDRDRVVPSAAAGRELASGLANARLEVLENAGHVVLPFEGQRWVERIAAFAAELG